LVAPTLVALGPEDPARDPIATAGCHEAALP
jgi:hypothetical protein